MICDKCKEIGLTSRCFLDAVKSYSDPNIEIYYDEVGKTHVHSESHSKRFFKCSNGHHFFLMFNRSGCDNCPEKFMAPSCTQYKVIKYGIIRSIINYFTRKVDMP